MLGRCGMSAYMDGRSTVTLKGVKHHCLGLEIQQFCVFCVSWNIVIVWGIYNVAYRPVAKWLCKHRPLLGNVSNMHATIEWLFYVVRAATVAVQRRGKYVYTKMRPCFTWGPCKGDFLKTNGATIQFWVLGRRQPRKVRLPVKTWYVIRRLYSCVILGVCDAARLL
jgi:hypothetical protein